MPRTVCYLNTMSGTEGKRLPQQDTSVGHPLGSVPAPTDTAGLTTGTSPRPPEEAGPDFTKQWNKNVRTTPGLAEGGGGGQVTL